MNHHQHHQTNIRLLHLIAFFAALYFYLPILTLYLQARGLSLLQVNSLWGIIVATMFCAEVPTGLLADRIGRKKSIIIALVLQFCGEAIFIFADRYAIFILTSIIAGLGFSFASGSFEALMYDSLKAQGHEGEMAKVLGLNQAFKQTAFIIAPPLGGYFAADLNLNRFVLVIALTATSVAVGVIASFFLHEETRESSAEEPVNSFKLLGDGLRLLRDNAALRRITWLTILGTPFLPYFGSLYQPYFVEVGIPSVWFGVAYSLGSLGAMLASRYAYRLEDTLGVGGGMLLASLLPGLFYWLLVGVFDPFWSFLWVILAWGSMNLREPLLGHYRNLHIESHNRATVLSLISMVSGLYVALVGLLIGWLADQSLVYAFGFIGALVIISGLIFRIDERHLPI